LRSGRREREIDMRPRTGLLGLSLFALALTLAIPASAAADESLSRKDIQMVAPALDKYTQNRLLGEVWKRPGLSLRDRSVVTVAALIGRNQMIALSEHLKLALDHGVKPAELSEIITHLAFYSGWANAISAIAIAKDVFAQRNVGPDLLPAGSPALLPLNEATEADRAKRVSDQFGAMFPGVVQYTTDVLFRDLWLRPDLAPRDRSLVTISALVANGQVAQLTGHIPIGMNNGLTQPEIAEALTHLAFYVGWPNVFSAMPVAKDVFEKRAR
jgi:4-carboxymuconolactone decarboxylase